MMSPIGNYLVEFLPFGLAPPPSMDDAVLPGEAALAVDVDQHERALAEARDAGAQDARQEAEARFLVREAELKAAQALELEAYRKDWSDAEGAALATQIADTLAALEDRIATALAAVLEPLLPGIVARQAVDAVRSAIESLLTSGEDRPIVVSGPADLVGALQASFAGKTALVCEPSDAAELSVRVGDTHIQSAMTTWAERLASEIEATR